MKTSLTALLFAGLMAAALVSPARAADDDVPSFKKVSEPGKDFYQKVGESVVKAVRSSPAKLEMADHKVTDPKPNRKQIDITMNWKGSISGIKFTSKVTVVVDPTDKDKWEVISIDYSDDNKVVPVGKAEKLEALKKKFNR